MQAFATFPPPKYKQHGYSLHTAFLLLYQKSIIKNIDCFPPPPIPQISINLQLIFSFFHCLAELLLHYFFYQSYPLDLRLLLYLDPNHPFPYPSLYFCFLYVKECFPNCVLMERK